MRWKEMKCTALALAFSTGLHAVLLDIPEHRAPLRKVYTSFIEKRQANKIRKKKQMLILKARNRIQQGRFKLGEFILSADEIDAKAGGKVFDYRKAKIEYERYLKELRVLLEDKIPPQDAIVELFGEMAYFGIGGTMEALLLNETGKFGGSCEPISHLIVSLLYDVGGIDERVYLKVYSNHISPTIFIDGSREIDLMASSLAGMG